VQTLLDRGTQEYRSGHYKQAAEAFQQAVEQDPSNLQAHLGLANACAIQHVLGLDSEENGANLRRARAEYQAALQMDPSNKKAI